MSQFDQDFQEQLAAHYLRDDVFVATAGSLVQPDFFDDETLAALVAVQREYLTRYGKCCTLRTFVQVLKKLVSLKRVKIADMKEASRLLGKLHKDPLKDREFVIDELADFARHQAMLNATLEMADALDANDASKISIAIASMEEAKAVGASDSSEAHDYRRGREERKQRRRDRRNSVAGVGGITTGVPELDKFLTPWRGWGRKELSILMGPPKSGKTAALVTFGINAATAGYNVFYASCEVSDTIIGDRTDANISGVPLNDFENRESEIDRAVADWEAKPGLGEFIVQSFPIRTLTVSALRRILKKYAAKGIHFDMIVVDYGDILKPEAHYQDKRHGLAEIFQDLRAMATDFNAAVLTATQTNREGTKKASRNVTDGTDAAEDYEKVRTADALITINASEADRDQGQVVLYFSEMRNAETGLRLRFEQNIACMRFITSFLRVDG